MSQLLTTLGAAKYLGVSVSYLRNLRNGQFSFDGPGYEYGFDKENRRNCYYQLEELDRWKKAQDLKKERIDGRNNCNRLRRENVRLRGLLKEAGIEF